MHRLKRALAHPAASWVGIALAIALSLPSLTTGFVADDWLQSLVASGRGGSIPGLPTSRFDLFSFAGNPSSRNLTLVDQGLFPWWTDPQMKLSFFRPVSSLTHVFDWIVWPGNAVMMHLHNLLWLGLALAAVAMFYRRFLREPWITGLATLLYAVDDAHGPALSWIANRNAMVALAIALPSVTLHDRFRRDGWRPGAYLAALAFAAGLLAGESAVAAGAYLLAYALFLDEGPWAKRLAALWPYATVFVGWTLVYRALGYGTHGSGVYVDPAGDPITFLKVLPSRATFLLASQFALPWSDFAVGYQFISPKVATVMLLVAVAVVTLFALVLLPLVRRSREARFLAAGTLLAVVPISSTFPADRLLWFVGVGAMGLLALWLSSVPRNVPGIAFASLLLLLHVVLAPPLLLLRSRSMETVDKPIQRANAGIANTPKMAGRTVVLINPATDLLAGYVAILRQFRGEPRPRFRWLATADQQIELYRDDERTLRLRPEGGLLAWVSERMLRSPERAPMPPGTRVELSDTVFEVLSSTSDGRPSEFKVTFTKPIDQYDFYAWRDRSYVPYTLPPVGAHVTLPKTDLLYVLFAK